MSTIVELRDYQTKILQRLKESFPDRHTIVELDCGLGKRVLTYLIIKKWFATRKVLLLLHSTTSYLETIHYFEKEYGNLENMAYFSSRTTGKMRQAILNDENNRIIVSTPQTFANVFDKIDKKPFFDIIIINEVDKIVRRSGDQRALVYPYNKLIPYFISQGSWLLGLTGTIRDDHVLYDALQEKFQIRAELVTLDSRIPGLSVIRMDELLGSSDINNYLQITTIEKFLVQPSDPLVTLLEIINDAIRGLREEIIKETQEEEPHVIEDVPEKKLTMIVGMLGGEKTPKYQGLLLVRKYLTAMQPEKYKRFLYKLKKISVTKELINSLPHESEKIAALVDLVMKTQEKTTILCSYISTAEAIAEKFTTLNIPTFMITGQVREKSKVLEAFKSIPMMAVLIMTSVGERDIDIPQSKLLIVYDVVNTAKTMYQRFKRTRGGRVLCLCYQGTFEERKVDRLFANIQNKYPWSVKFM